MFILKSVSPDFAFCVVPQSHANNSQRIHKDSQSQISPKSCKFKNPVILFTQLTHPVIELSDWSFLQYHVRG